MIENYLWLIVAVILAVVEGATLNLTTIWFALGALAAWLVTFLNFSWGLQIGVFVLVSGILLIFTKPLVKKYLKVGRVKTNAEEVIGMNAIVTEEINNIDAKGKVKVKGQIWTARSDDSQIIKIDSIVKVLRIEGVKLIVRKLKEDN
ncbi:MAG: NfeD family protein [Bacillota bacterium]|nr:NfeD family protein [Bacillota bacterium]